MGDPPETTSGGWQRLWETLAARPPEHPLDLPRLGEFAALTLARGRQTAEQTFPEVPAHLATGCPACAADLREMLEVLQADTETTPGT